MQKISVVIPTFNRASHCVAAVESVLAQSHRDTEIIVVDDGSTDGTEQVVRSRFGSRVRYIRQANAGVTRARNTGLEAARGDFVAFLDSDDTWFPWKLEAQLAILRRFPDVGMTWTDMTAVDEHGAELHERYIRKMYCAYEIVDTKDVLTEHVPLHEIWTGCPAELADAMVYIGNLFAPMFLGNMVHTSTVLMTGERRKRTGFFDEDLTKTGEDYDFHLRACSHGRVAMLDIPSIHYRIGASDQLTAPELVRWMARNNLKTIEKVWNSEQRPEELSRSRIARRFADAHLWVGKEELWFAPRAARPHLWKSIRWNPWQLPAWCYSLLTFFPTAWAQRMRAFKRQLVAQ